MSLDDIVGLLARLSAFAGMGRGPLMYIAQYAVPRYFEPGEVLFNEGENAETGYLVIYGNAVAVSESGTSREFYEGDLMGELAMFTQVSRNMTCVARTRLTVLEIHRKLMHGLLRQDPLALDYTRNRIARRISEIRSNLESLKESLDAHVIPGEARMEAAEEADAAVAEAVDTAGDPAFADRPHHAEAHYAAAGYNGAQPSGDDGAGAVYADDAYPDGADGESRYAEVHDAETDHADGEAGPAYGNGRHYPSEYDQVLSVLGPVSEDLDGNAPAPEYDRTELPSLLPRPPVAA
ncbi:MAG: Crp/Fnr family transcriptional regulator [Hyphomicrobiales bacterium]